METARFASPQESSRWAVRLLAVTAVAYALTVMLEWSEISVISRVLNGEPVSKGEIDAAVSHVHTLFRVILALDLLTGAVFLNWFFRAYRNVRPLGARELRYSQGWALGSWFVPLLNLVRPFNIACDMWRAGDPRAARDLGAGWRSAPVPGMFAFWWLAFLGSSTLGRVGGLLVRHATTAEALRTARWLTIVSSVIGIAAAWGAARVVQLTTARQVERAALLGTQPLTS